MAAAKADAAAAAAATAPKEFTDAEKENHTRWVNNAAAFLYYMQRINPDHNAEKFCCIDARVLFSQSADKDAEMPLPLFVMLLDEMLDRGETRTEWSLRGATSFSVRGPIPDVVCGVNLREIAKERYSSLPIFKEHDQQAPVKVQL